jgi:hypothetical protein
MVGSLCLVLPQRGPHQSGRSRLHWLANVGDAIAPERPIARLLGPSIVDVRSPDGIAGTLGSRLIEEGARIAPGDALLTFVPQNGYGTSHARDCTTGLAEEARAFAPRDGRLVVVAEVTDMNRIRPIAIVGLVFLLGMASTVITTIAYLVLGGIAPLLLGALALSIVALALIYGEQHLESRDGFPG